MTPHAERIIAEEKGINPASSFHNEFLAVIVEHQQQQASCEMKFLLLSCLFLISSCWASDSSVEKNGKRRPLKIVNMSWSDCADPKTTGVNVTRVEVGPDPVILPGTLNIGFDAIATKSLVKGSPFKVRMQKKVSFFWVDVPCQNTASGNRIGSCDYADFCNHWPLPGPDCAQSYKDHGIPCQCPWTPGHYSMPLLPVGTIKDVHIPQWLEKGDFKITAWVTPPGSEDKLICLELNLKLDHP